MPKKILVVEDDTALANQLAGALGQAGLEVTVSNDGETGFRQIQEKHPDLIILDLVLPKKHGFKVLEDLQKNSELKTIPVIILTNLETPQDIERAFSFGAKAYLVKANYSLPEIVKKVQGILSGNEN
ncbi:MAG: response regulator [Patescibacteria group bacterium]|mgnify:CR=1 FL=1